MTRASRAGRARELLVNAALASTTVVAGLADDPLLLVVQTSRRLPARVTRAAVALLGGGAEDAGGPGAPAHDRGQRSTRRALAAWLAGRPQDVRDVLARAADDGPGSGARSRLRAELAVQVGLPHLVARLCAEPPAVTRSRAAGSTGAVTQAIEALPAGSALRTRLEVERELLTGRRRPALPPRPAPAVAATGPGAPVRVLHVLTNSVPHTHSGYTTRSHAVLRAQRDAGVAAAAVTRLGYPVTVGALAARHRDVVDGVPYGRLLPARLPRRLDTRLQAYADRAAPLAAALRPDVLHTTTEWVNGLVTRAVAEHLRVPWVYEVRGLLEETWVANRPTDEVRRAAATSERHALLRERETAVMLAADHVVTLSATLAAELTARGVDPARVTVVPNGVDPALVADDLAPDAARAALGLPRAGLWVGTVSSLVDYEGLETVLDAVALLRAGGVDARACVVGDGVARPRLEAHARRLGLGAHAVFTGRVPRDRAVLHHRALDVFTVPRRDERVCRLVTPLKPVEAMACGRPVVASDLPALAEVVAGPGTGVLAPAGDAGAWAAAIAALGEDDDRRAELGAAGRRFAAGRTWEAAARTYRRLYEDLVGGAA